MVNWANLGEGFAAGIVAMFGVCAGAALYVSKSQKAQRKLLKNMMKAGRRGNNKRRDAA
jgi:hypothetical protein